MAIINILMMALGTLIGIAMYVMVFVLGFLAIRYLWAKLNG